MRSKYLTTVVVTIVVVGLTATVGVQFNRSESYRTWFLDTQSKLIAIAERRPESVPPGEWEYLVGWTINLHANTAGPVSSFDHSYRDRLNIVLKKDVLTDDDIDEIWRIYSLATPTGKKYSDTFSPLRPDDSDRKAAQRGCFNMWVK